MPLRSYLQHVMDHRDTLSRDAARDLLNLILTAPLPDSQPPTLHLQLAALLAALAARGETAAELAGFADALRAAATPLPLTPAEQSALVDTCGTGGDASGTFNISTAAALVGAAAGAIVAKHGNRAVTSRSGSADVLEALGIPIDLSPTAAAEALRHHRFAFLHAPALHPAMRAVMPVRRALGVRTVFNAVGPLANPAGARRQVVGVYGRHLVPVVAEALLLLGTTHALVVHGEAPNHLAIDELSLSGPTDLAEVHNGRITRTTLQPEDLGLTRVPLEALRGGDARANATILRAVFSGEPGPRRDIVLLNAAAVLLVAGLAPDLPTGLARAAHAVDSGAVTDLVASLAQPLR